MKNELPVGFMLPMYRALTEKVLFLGAPPELILLNAGVGLLCMQTFHFFWILPLNVIFHFSVLYISKFDTRVFECFMRYFKEKDYYDT